MDSERFEFLVLSAPLSIVESNLIMICLRSRLPCSLLIAGKMTLVLTEDDSDAIDIAESLDSPRPDSLALHSLSLDSWKLARCMNVGLLAFDQTAVLVMTIEKSVNVAFVRPQICAEVPPTPRCRQSKSLRLVPEPR